MAKKTTTLKKKSSQKKRTYDNSTRSNKSAQNQTIIIEALVELLAEKRGEEVQIQEIADKTGITKRTIFRFFKDKKTLHQAMDSYLMSYLSAGARQLSELNFVDFGKNAIDLFEENEAITLAYVLSPLGREARGIFRSKLNELMREKILAEYGIKETPETKPKLAVIINLVNAKIWYDLKTEHGLSGKEVASAIAWALKSLLQSLKQK